MPVGIYKRQKDKVYGSKGKHWKLSEEIKKKLKKIKKGTKMICSGWNKGLTKKDDDRIRKNAENISKAILLKYKDLEYRKRRMEGYENREPLFFSVKAREEMRRKMIKKWKEDDFVKKQMKARGCQPNKTEIFLAKFINQILPNEYKFVGDGNFILGGKCPDFLNINGKKS